MLDRKAILASTDIRTMEVKVPEWGGSIFVRTLDGHARDELDTFVAQRKDTKDLRGFRIRIVILAASDENGNRLFTDADAEALNAKSSVVLERIEKAACALNGIGGDAVEVASADFPPTRAGNSGSV